MFPGVHSCAIAHPLKKFFSNLPTSGHFLFFKYLVPKPQEQHTGLPFQGPQSLWNNFAISLTWGLFVAGFCQSKCLIQILECDSSLCYNNSILVIYIVSTSLVPEACSTSREHIKQLCLSGFWLLQHSMQAGTKGQLRQLNLFFHKSFFQAIILIEFSSTCSDC